MLTATVSFSPDRVRVLQGEGALRFTAPRLLKPCSGGLPHYVPSMSVMRASPLFNDFLPSPIMDFIFTGCDRAAVRSARCGRVSPLLRTGRSETRQSQSPQSGSREKLASYVYSEGHPRGCRYHGEPTRGWLNTIRNFRSGLSVFATRFTGKTILGYVGGCSPDSGIMRSMTGEQSASASCKRRRSRQES